MRSTLRPLLSLMVTVLLTLLPRVVQAQAPQVFTGTGPDGVATAIAAFKAAIGGADNGAFPGSLPTGYRQVTWDDVPDQYAEPNNLPPDFYNTVSPRGLMLNPIGYVGAFQVSATVPNPTSTPVLFGHADLFTTFSAPRIFSGGSESGPGAAVRFNVPGATTAAMVSGFGVVFTDVQIASTARLILYDADYQPLGTFNAPVTPDHRNVSFIGVVFPTARIHHVYLSQGTYRGSSSMPEDASHDLVALDDVVYGEPQPVPPPTLTVTTPTAQTTFDAGGPFVTLAGRGSYASGVAWTNDRGGSGSLGGVSPNWVIRDIPLAPGPNVITLTATGTFDPTLTTTTVLHVNSDVFTYHLAEGSTGGFFDTDISIANPNAEAAPVTISFLREDGGHVELTDTIAPTSRKTVHVDQVPGVEATAFSTVVRSDHRLPLIVERTMFWDQDYYGGKGATAVDTPSETWLFAEGVQNSFFNTYVLLENPNATAATAALTFEIAFGEPPVIQNVALPPLSRVTVDAGAIPALVGRSFGLTVHATQPIIAERATYFESTPAQLWGGGHGSAGVTAPAYVWYFAEGATGPFRDTFLLVSNPNDVPTPVSVSFVGGPDHTSEFSVGPIGPHERLTVPVETLTEGPLRPGESNHHPLEDAEFTAVVRSSFPVVAERAMYWVGAPGPYADGTSTFGTASFGFRWGFAEGRVGGPLDFHTYIRILSTGLTPAGGIQWPAEVKVTFLKTDGTTIVRNYTVPAFNQWVPSKESPLPFITIDVNAIPELADQSFGTVIEGISGPWIVVERSMYWNAGGVFWAGGITTAGTKLP